MRLPEDPRNTTRTCEDTCRRVPGAASAPPDCDRSQEPSACRLISEFLTSGGLTSCLTSCAARLTEIPIMKLIQRIAVWNSLIDFGRGVNGLQHSLAPLPHAGVVFAQHELLQSPDHRAVDIGGGMIARLLNQQVDGLGTDARIGVAQQRPGQCAAHLRI